jgi:hypothetical protein
MPIPQTIFRFDELKYAKPFVENGIVSFGPAASYDDSKLSAAQRDNELQRSSAPDVAHHQVLVASPGGQPQALKNLRSIKISSDIRNVDGEYLHYYILCCSLCDDRRFYAEFPKVDCCVTIYDTPEFHRRLDAALKAKYAGWGGGSRGVSYFSPSAAFVANKTLDLVFAKDDSYAWQQEFRFALFSPIDEAHRGRVELSLGSLKDICSIATK